MLFLTSCGGAWAAGVTMEVGRKGYAGSLFQRQSRWGLLMNSSGDGAGVSAFSWDPAAAPYWGQDSP